MRRNERPFKDQGAALRNTALVAVMVIMTFLALTFLGIIHSGAPDFERIRQVVMENHDPEVMTEGDERALRKAYGFSTRELESFVYYAPSSSMDASEILVVHAGSPAEAQSMEVMVEERRSIKEETFRNYRPRQAAILERSHLKTQGSFLIFISADNVSDIKDKVERAFR